MGKLKEILGKVAPTIATALGGPFAGMAVKALGDALGVDSDGKTTEQVEKELLEQFQRPQDPEIWLKAKQADNQLEAQLAEIGIKREELHQRDRESARERQMRLQDKTPQVLAYLSFAAFITALVGLFFFFNTERPVQQGLLSLVNVAFGILLVMVRDAWQFFFGSSAGSKSKTDALVHNLNK